MIKLKNCLCVLLMILNLRETNTTTDSVKWDGEAVTRWKRSAVSYRESLVVCRVAGAFQEDTEKEATRLSDEFLEHILSLQVAARYSGQTIMSAKEIEATDAAAASFQKVADKLDEECAKLQQLRLEKAVSDRIISQMSPIVFSPRGGDETR